MGNSTVKISYTGNVKLTFDNKEYSVDVKATADYWYQPMVMYFSDGSGQPEDWDYEIDSIDCTWYELGKEGNKTQIIPNEDMLEDLEEWLYENAEWEFPEDEY